MPTKLIVDCSTGIATEVELTPEDIAQQEKDMTDFAERKATEEAEAQAKAELKASARAKLISGTPLTEEEAAVLVIQSTKIQNLISLKNLRPTTSAYYRKRALDSIGRALLSILGNELVYA